MKLLSHHKLKSRALHAASWLLAVLYLLAVVYMNVKRNILKPPSPKGELVSLKINFKSMVKLLQ